MTRYITGLGLVLLIAACTPIADQPAPPGTPCSEPRPMVCTMDYQPVCGHDAAGVQHTYANGCSACSHAEILGYDGGACPE